MLLCIGAPLVIAGVLWGAFNLIFLLRAKETTGRIVGEKSHHSNQNGTTHSPIVEFQGPDGQMIEFTENLGSSADLGAITGIFQLLFSLLRGKSLDEAAEDAVTVRVVYDPRRPTRAHIKGFQYLFLVPTILIVAGVIVSQFDNPIFMNFPENLVKQLAAYLP